MNISLKRLLISALIIFIFLPNIILAASQGLVPCVGGDPNAPGGCNFCSILLLVKNVVNFLLQIAVPVGVLVLMVGGFQMVTAAGNTTKVQEGQKLMTQAAVGFIIMLTGWLIVNTLIKTLAQGVGKFSPDTWFEFTCQ